LREQLNSNENQSDVAADAITEQRTTISSLETDLGNMTQECQRLSRCGYAFQKVLCCPFTHACSELERCHNDKLELETNTKIYMSQLRQLTTDLQVWSA
jgi:chromosome segregation ATPase